MLIHDCGYRICGEFASRPELVKKKLGCIYETLFVMNIGRTIDARHRFITSLLG